MQNKVVQNIIEAIDSKKSLQTISLLDAMKMLVVTWDEVTDKTVQNCFMEVGFSEIKDDDAVSDDPFAVLKGSITQLSILDKTFEDVTTEDVTSFDDILVSTQEPLSDEDILAGYSGVDIDDQHKSDKNSSQSEVSEVLIKQNPSQVCAAIDTLMNYSMIIGTAELQGLAMSFQICGTRNNKLCKTKKKMTDFFSS